MAAKPQVTRAGCGIMILKDNKVLLGLRNDDKVKASSALNGEGTWTFPGGKYDFHDGLFEGIQRELKEETDLNLKKAKVISITNERVEKAHFVTLGWLAEDWDGDLKTMEPDEIIKWEWFDLNNLPTKLYTPTKKIIENFNNNIFIKEEDLI